jgi:arylsulfatase A-like enzyme
MKLAVYVLLLTIVASGCMSSFQKHQDNNETAIIDHISTVSVFQKSADILNERVHKTSQKAQGFDQDTALTDLKPSQINGFYYLLDEHLNESVHSGEPQNCSLRPLYDAFIDNTTTIRPVEETYRFMNGTIVIEKTSGGHIEFSTEDGIHKEGVGIIEIKARNAKGMVITVGLSNNRTANFSWQQTNTAEVDVIADNESHVYRISAQNLLGGLFANGEPVRKLFLRPSDVVGDRVEIEYLRFLSREGKYCGSKYGRTYEVEGLQMRPVIFIRTPGSLAYRISLPNGTVGFKFGAGIFDWGERTTFKVLIGDGANQRTIFEKNVYNESNWTDAQIDLTEYAGRNVILIIEATGEGENVAFWADPVIFSPPKRAFNVLIILEDALRADHVGTYGYQRDTTPFKDSFSKGGVVFLNAFSQGTNTRISCPTIMTSLYPTAAGVVTDYQYLDDEYLTLAEIMRSQGFETASFLQNSYCGPTIGLHQGFGTLVDDPMWWAGRRPSENMLSLVDTWLNEHTGRNFFMYLHVLDPHGDYDPQEGYRQWYSESLGKGKSVEPVMWLDPPRLTNETDESRMARYDGEIRQNDDFNRALIEGIKARGILDDTLVIFMADHGENMGEHDLWGHGSPGFAQVLHVQMIMIYPRGLPQGARIVEPVQNIDVMPTILELAGIDASGLIIQGYSLFPLMNGQNMSFWRQRIVFSEDGSHKSDRYETQEWASVFMQDTHIMQGDGYKTRVFNFTEDAQEKKGRRADIVVESQFKDIYRELQKNNLDVWKAVVKNESNAMPMDVETRRRLRALGYVN